MELPLSICIIFSASDADVLNGCLSSLPKGVEVILLQTIPSVNIPKANSLIPVLQQEKKDEFGTTFKQYSLEYFKEDFSFSKFRNACKSMATREWVLSLDADDYLMYIEDEFKEVFSLPCAVGGVECTVLSHLMPEESSHAGVIHTQSVHIHRNYSNFFYKNRVHEEIRSSIRFAGYEIYASPILIKHTGYFNDDKDFWKTKMSRNFKLLLKDLFDNDNPVLMEKLLQTLTAQKKLGVF